MEDVTAAAASEHLLCKPARGDWKSFRWMTFYRDVPMILLNMRAAVWGRRIAVAEVRWCPDMRDPKALAGRERLQN